MKILSWVLLTALCSFNFMVKNVQAKNNEYMTYYIGKNKIYETPYHVFDNSEPGPVVLLEGGIHGDELAGTYALDDLLPKFRVHSGKLIVLPRMNLPACNAVRRFVNADLNLIFPGKKGEKFYEHALAREIFDMVGKKKVEYVVTLHESRYLHNPNKPRTFGQTVVYGVKPMPGYLMSWLEAVNKHTSEKEKFHPYYFPVKRSSTEIFVESYKMKGGFCVETFRKFKMERRTELHKIVVLEFLKTIGFKYSLEE